MVDSLQESPYQALAQQTYSAYIRRLKEFDDWCDTHSRLPSDTSVAEFIDVLFERGHSKSVPIMLLAALRFRARITDGEAPCGMLSRLAMRRYVRDSADRGKGSPTPLSPSEIRQMVHYCTLDGETRRGKAAKLRGYRDAAALLVASYGMLRTSEIAELDILDLEVDGINTFRVRKSKTDQAGVGKTLYLGDKALEAIKQWLESAGIPRDEHGPLFRSIDQGGRIGGKMSSLSVLNMVKRRCDQAGFDGRYSGHSIRIGMALYLASEGATLVELQQAGRWSSPTMPAYYTRGQQAREGAMARIVDGKKKGRKRGRRSQF